MARRHRPRQQRNLAGARFIWTADHQGEPAISWFDWKDFE